MSSDEYFDLFNIIKPSRPNNGMPEIIKQGNLGSREALRRPQSVKSKKCLSSYGLKNLNPVAKINCADLCLRKGMPIILIPYIICIHWFLKLIVYRVNDLLQLNALANIIKIKPNIT